MRLVRADGALHDRILDETFPLWHDGLSRERYGLYNAAQMRTPWGARHLERLALVDDDGRLLASAKRYRLDLMVDGSPVPTLGIGAVFTPPSDRRRGYARALIEHLVDVAAAEGAGAALLFSEIGPGYYEKIGFVAMPLIDAELTIAGPPGAPMMMVRTVEPQDLPHLVDLHHAMAGTHRLSLRWDAEWLAYGLAKKRMLAAFAPGSGRVVECFVAEEGGRPVAWVQFQVSGRDLEGYREGWSLEACGDRDPSGARVGALLQALVARNPSVSPPLIRGWWPARLQPPQVTVHPRGSSPITMMIRPLASGIAPGALGARDVLYWHGDAF